MTPLLAVALLAAGGGTVPGMPYWLVGAASALGGFLVTLLSGKIVVPTFAYNREKERADKWEEKFLGLSSALAERHVPALDAATHAIGESNEAIKQAIAALGRRRNT